jgi:hypothetical protein
MNQILEFFKKEVEVLMNPWIFEMIMNEHNSTTGLSQHAMAASAIVSKRSC